MDNSDATIYAWQPAGPQAWPEKVNEALSRHGAGLEDNERQIRDLTGRVKSLELIITQLIREIHQVKSGGE